MAYGNGAGWFTSEGGGVRESERGCGRVKPTIKNILWVEHGRGGAKVGRKPMEPFVTFADYGLCFNIRATQMLVTEEVRYKFAVADYEEGGKKVKALLLRQGKNGYKITFSKKRRCSTNKSPGLIRQLSGAGLKFGRYELVKPSGNGGVWLGLPMEGAEK